MNKNDDYDKSNHTKRSSTYQVEYALEFNGKIWSVDKLADLTVAICPSALQYASQFGVKDYEIIAALQKWNDVSISGQKIKITAMITNTEEPDADIKVIARITHEDFEASAGTSLGEGGQYFVPRTVEIALNTFNPYGWEEHTAEQRKSTFTHEMGHALGLGESECLDQSVMVSDSFANNRKTYITAHDKYALNYLYTHV